MCDRFDVNFADVSVSDVNEEQEHGGGSSKDNSINSEHSLQSHGISHSSQESSTNSLPVGMVDPNHAMVAAAMSHAAAGSSSGASMAAVTAQMDQMALGFHRPHHQQQASAAAAPPLQPKSKLSQVSVARWQNLIPSFPWIAPGRRAWGRNPMKGRDQILERSVAEPKSFKSEGPKWPNAYNLKIWISPSGNLVAGQPPQDVRPPGLVLHGRRNGWDRPQELCHDPDDVDSAAAAEGAPAGGDARADVRVQEDAEGPPGGARAAGGQLQAGDGEAQEPARPRVRAAAHAVQQGPRAAASEAPGRAGENGKASHLRTHPRD